MKAGNTVTAHRRITVAETAGLLGIFVVAILILGLVILRPGLFLTM